MPKSPDLIFDFSGYDHDWLIILHVHMVHVGLAVLLQHNFEILTRVNTKFRPNATAHDQRLALSHTLCKSIEVSKSFYNTQQVRNVDTMQLQC